MVHEKLINSQQPLIDSIQRKQLFNGASVYFPAFQACRISTTCTPTALRSLWSWAVINFLLRHLYPQSGWATERLWFHTLSRLERNRSCTALRVQHHYLNGLHTHKQTNACTHSPCIMCCFAQFKKNYSDINRSASVEHTSFMLINNIAFNHFYWLFLKSEWILMTVILILT